MSKRRTHKAPAPPRKNVEEKTTAAQRDRHALKQDIKRLEGLTIVGWNQLTDDKNGIPELEELRQALTEALFRAQPASGHPISYPDDDTPRKAATLPTARSGHKDPISKDALSTAEGRPTLNARKRLKWARDEIHILALDVLRTNAPDQDTINKPRCRRRNCRLYDRRQPHGNQYCGACGTVLTIETRPQSVTAMTTSKNPNLL